MEIEQLCQLIQAVSDSKLTEFSYEEDGVKITMASGKETVIQQAAGTQEAAADAPKPGQVITSPLVGVFYAAPSEDAEPFVKLGDTVKEGQVVAIVEAMKLMNEIESDCSGKIVEILVENGQAVEYGQPLFRVEP